MPTRAESSRLAALACAASLALAACGSSSSDEALACGEATTASPTLGQAFVLGVADAATLRNTGLTVAFVAIDEDSRCPSDLNCIVPGNAAARLQAQRAPTPAEEFVLNTGQDPRQHLYEGYIVALDEVLPARQSTRPIAPNAYCVRLTVTAAP